MIAGLDSSVGIDSLKRYDATEFIEHPHFFFFHNKKKVVLEISKTYEFG